MLAAHELGMATSGEYVFINIDVSTGSHAEKPWVRANETNQEENEKAKEAYRALKTISLRRSDLEEYKNFEKRVKIRAEEKYDYSRITGKEYEMNNFISAFYDAVLLYAIALNETIAAGMDPRNGHNITSKMWGRTFDGITGNVSIDANGDRYSDYSLLDLDPAVDKFVEVAYYSGASNELKKVTDFHWIGGKPPRDSPICGLSAACLSSSCIGGTDFIAHFAVCVLLAKIVQHLGGTRARFVRARCAPSLYLFIGHRFLAPPGDEFDMEIDPLPRSSSSGATRKISAMIDRKFSIFTRKKSSPNQDKNGGIGTGVHGNVLKEVESGECSPMNEVQFRLPNDRRISSPSGDSECKKKSSAEDDFENVAKKSLSLRNRKLSFFGSIKGIMVAIKKLNIDQKKYPKVDLSRAQLMELKKMKDLQHDHITRFTGACLDAPHWCIVTEYCPKGSLEDILENDQIKLDNMMKYSLLHDLVKVTDFGLHRLHAMEEITIDDIGEHAFYRKFLWTAPELLRNSNPPPMGTQKGDIYSFAIILHEVLWRKGVFPVKNESLSPYEIIQRVKKPVTNPDDVFRPFVPDSLDADDDINQSLLELMRCSWAEDSHDRPDISMIRKALISGKAVQAESYDSVTIYFSDIVGFTALSSQSTPLQVVTLLNDLYLAFDGVVDNFKVYKVETIGDAYMVVSGLPERRDDHASQIAQMSLALLHKVKNFVIRHRPNDQLKLRIGMHSGSVVAGVVGSKMPRYCLFGDTVNTSSRMESNGLPLRIHVSSVTKEILSKDTGFRLELRGEVEMKGKGRLTTYWLKGYRDVNIPDFGPEYQ
ncbi:adenylate/guanylate cyclase catalytic domain protein [Teladorsagia circumcincta]|uniref:Guanylate cyclase n=1 Tax=Teladorsagia circumcincta TaxID=45464 RepID=A0A2G9USE8_TELCI|nr:adenylate/guanylate cyclase catalytic domain protein [Teladorsagia circumcincta]